VKANEGRNHETVASLSTFRRALDIAVEMHNIRMMRCKGALNTCEICNNSSDLLNNKGIRIRY